MTDFIPLMHVSGGQLVMAMPSYSVDTRRVHSLA
jgi:hypothetical protein